MEKKEKLSSKPNLKDIEDAPFFKLSGTYKAKCVKCYDGDTIHVIIDYKGEFVKIRVRMYGYDSPEMKPSKKIPEEKRQEIKNKANLAKDYISELILGKIVILEIISEKEEKYGRILGIIKLDKNEEKSVNDMMVEQNHGYKYYGGKKEVS
jgi:endonuclease YncB( thermonuclease family)